MTGWAWGFGGGAARAWDAKVFLLLFFKKRKCFCFVEGKSWMPAFAGMTRWGRDLMLRPVVPGI
jgi:hypothetical protein